MKTATIDRLIWVLVYGGLIAIALGLSVRRGDAALGWGFVAGGAAIAIVGAVLVVVRARMKDKPA
jgi:vacuolar-type H+-ATPase subunit I/STV1